MTILSRFARCAALLLAAVPAAQTQAADLTAIEQRWLQAVWPVIVFAKAERLPLDIVVQPQPTPGVSPMAMGYVGGRCKLVLSMRGNPAVATMMASIEAPMQDAALALMAAHELGHCQRHAQGAWHGLPSAGKRQDSAATASSPGAVPDANANANASINPKSVADADDEAARREEAYGDLIGLAWIQQHRPQHYARLHAWLLAERADDGQFARSHDTEAWLRLATQGAVLAGPSVFAAATALWAQGLQAALAKP